LNVRAVSVVTQTELRTTEPLVRESSAFGVEMAIEKLESPKLPGTDQIPAEIVKAGGRTICSEIDKLSNSIWDREKLLRSGRSG
jgi:hypothetical protein